MCGIVGAIALRNISSILVEGLKRLEYRGYDSSGVAILSDQGLQRTRRVGKVASLDAALMQSPLQGNVGIAHTRWATHGVPNEVNAHPHWSHSSLAVVHNGIIDNFELIKADLIATGYGFDSDTDTEVIAHLIHRNRQQGMSLTQAVREAAGRCEGAYALGVVDETQPDLLLAARKGSPLVIGLGSDEIIGTAQLPDLILGICLALCYFPLFVLPTIFEHWIRNWITKLGDWLDSWLAGPLAAGWARPFHPGLGGRRV